jgi:hypothetical protein
MSNPQRHSSPLCVLQASLTYFGISLGTAIVLDSIRRTTFEPRFGKLIAVLIELPALLSMCWWGSLWSTARFDVSSGERVHRIAMCCVSFALFVIVEITISFFVLEQTLTEFCTAYVKSYSPANPAALLGRIGEVVYGVIPLLQGIMQEQNRISTWNKRCENSTSSETQIRKQG